MLPFQRRWVELGLTQGASHLAGQAEAARTARYGALVWPLRLAMRMTLHPRTRKHIWTRLMYCYARPLDHVSVSERTAGRRMTASVHCKAESGLFLEWIASQVWPVLESKPLRSI